MKTSVEWLVQEIEKLYIGNFNITFLKQIEQAKEMEKQQIVDAVDETISEMNLYESYRTLQNGEQYYKETFE